VAVVDYCVSQDTVIMMESIAGHLHSSRHISCCSLTFRLHRILTFRVSAPPPYS